MGIQKVSKEFRAITLQYAHNVGFEFKLVNPGYKGIIIIICFANKHLSYLPYFILQVTNVHCHKLKLLL